MNRDLLNIAFATSLLVFSVSVSAQAEPQTPDAAKVDFQWAVKIPLRDGIRLNATVYTPKEQRAPAPCIFTLTPYISQTYHDRGVYFAAHGLPFLTVDVRGRGNSEGVFKPLIQEARDGYDVVEWLAKQPYCNGKVSMWGGSYAGYNQWATAKELPPHLATIVPAAAAYPGFDFPMRSNISDPYVMQWLTFTSGRASQDKIFGDAAFWATLRREWVESGQPFKNLDSVVGNASSQFQEWIAHPARDAYWDAFSPTPQHYAQLPFPILTITGSYDGDQPGALNFYREHQQHGSAQSKAQHYLIIGPWDHAGTRTPKAEFGGLKFAPASLVDLPKLHLEWYAWTMQGGPKPEFLKERVAYYVMGAESWRYAPTLEAVTERVRPYYLDSGSNANSVLTSGSLGAAAGKGSPDHYVYDPRDVSSAAVEAALNPLQDLIEQRMIYNNSGRHLVYHSAPFDTATEISGFFKFSAWLSIDQADTDFAVTVYEIGIDGSSILLSTDQMRARYRESLREAQLIRTKQPLRYDFERFMFVSREVKKGSRLRLVIAPIENGQKNYNSGGVVSEESVKDARPVKVTLFHDRAHPSALYVPIGRGNSASK